MTEASLTQLALKRLRASRLVALTNLEFYACIYDSLDNSAERETIGQAMAQKHSFIGAVEAILNNHGINTPDYPVALTSADCGDVSKDIEMGEHLAQEERFYASIQNCIEEMSDDLTVDLLEGHLKAAELAVTAIKSTSLKI